MVGLKALSFIDIAMNALSIFHQTSQGKCSLQKWDMCICKDINIQNLFENIINFVKRHFKS